MLNRVVPKRRGRLAAEMPPTIASTWSRLPPSEHGPCQCRRQASWRRQWKTLDMPAPTVTHYCERCRLREARAEFSRGAIHTDLLRYLAWFLGTLAALALVCR
jgi:hypothetical protein